MHHRINGLCSVSQIAPVENDDSYDELKRDAKTCLSLMSQGLLYTDQIPLVLSVLKEASHLEAKTVTPRLARLKKLFRIFLHLGLAKMLQTFNIINAVDECSLIEFQTNQTSANLKYLQSIKC